MAASTETQSLKKTRKKKEKASEPPKPPSRNLLVETKLQEYLDHVASTQEITLEEFEQEYKPLIHPVKKLPEYENEYNKLMARLVRSFSLVQLRKIVRLYELDASGKSTKWHLAATIVESKWKWPSLTKMKQAELDLETIDESFPLDAKQAFLLLGKDGADLLELSSKFGVHVSFASNPLALNVEGSRASINELSVYIRAFKMSVKEQFFQLPQAGFVGPETLQRISRTSGVFVEDAGEGSVRLTYKDGDDRAIHSAKRLTSRAATETKTTIPALLYSAQAQPKHTLGEVLSSQPAYSFYPFLSSQPKTYAPKQQRSFRVRRIEDWLRSSLRNEGENVGSLAETAGTMDFSGKLLDLRQALLAQASSLYTNEGYSQLRITASFGHLLVSTGLTQSNIMHPLFGSQKLDQVLEWLKSESASERVFLSSLPQSLINSPPAQQRLIHRLVYQTSMGTHSRDSELSEDVLKFELVLDDLKSSIPSKMEGKDDGDRDSEDFDRPPREDGSAQNVIPVQDIALAPSCWVESISHIDLMLPDRPMDIRFSLSTKRVLEEKDWPNDLQSYFNQLKSFLTSPEQASGQPEAPLTLTKEYVEYRLSLSSTIRQTVDPIPNLRPLPDPSLHTVVESILELDNKHRSRLCQVTCDDLTSDASWIPFLNYCNGLTSPAPLNPKMLIF